MEDHQGQFREGHGQNKPSEKFLKVFDKRSGLTSAIAAFDKAVDADDKEAARKAAVALRETGEACEQVLGQAAAGESDKSAQVETKVMFGAIKARGDLNAFSRQMKNKINGSRVIEYAKIPTAQNRGVPAGDGEGGLLRDDL